MTCAAYELVASLIRAEGILFQTLQSIGLVTIALVYLLAQARAQVAALIGAAPAEIVFTGGGSEASNLALKGVAFAALAGGPARDVHVITTAVEHPATLVPCAFLERLGCRVTVAPVDRFGVASTVSPEATRWVPDAVSTVRGGGLPMRAAGVTVFGMMPPSLA